MKLPFFGNVKKRTVSFITLWDEILSAKLIQNKSILGDRKKYNAYCDISGIYSGTERISYLYTIDGLPKELENSFVTGLRSECLGNTRLSCITILEKSGIDWESPQVKNKLRIWRKIDENEDEGDVFSFARDQKEMDNNTWKRESIVYLVDALKRRKRAMYKLRCLMIISGTRGEDFDKSVKQIISTARSNGFRITRVLGDIPEFLSVFSPFAYEYKQETLDLCGNQSMTDEHLARVNTYAQGQVGKYGKYFGTDIYSGYPTFKVFKKTADTAENILITAETGGGKSYFVKGVIYQLLADPKYVGTIMDVEGFEYIPIQNFLANHEKSIMINMGEGSGAYFDPVSITLIGDQELDSGMYSLSLSFTTSVIKCLLGDLMDTPNEWRDSVIMDAIQNTYAKAGVEPNDMSTWSNSDDLTLYDVYKNLKLMKTMGSSDKPINAVTSQSIYEQYNTGKKDLVRNDVNSLITAKEGYQEAIDSCIARLSKYFEPNGVRSYFFTERITVDEIRDAKLVLCSFGMAGRAESSVDPTQMALMQLYAANISHLRSMFGKMAGKYNFKVWEEFQRWGKFPDADKTINVALTGGRKLGDLNFIITNKVSDLLEDDKFGIFGNIQSFAIGCIGDAQVRQELCIRLGIESLQDDLDMLYSRNTDLSSYVEGDTFNSDIGYANPYAKGFLIGLDRTVYTLVKMQLPEAWANSSLFRTGVNIK